MSSSPHSEVLEFGVSSTCSKEYLGPVVRRNLQLAHDATSPSMALMRTSSSPKATSLPSPSPPPSPHLDTPRGAVLNDIGVMLSQNALLLSVFTDNIIQGPHIERLSRDLHRHCHAESSFSDIKEITTYDLTFTRLRKIRDLTTQFSREVQSIWRQEAASSETLSPTQSLMSPTSDMKALAASRSLSLSGSEGDVKPFKPRKILLDSDHAEEVSPRSNGTMSDDSDDEDDDEMFQQIDMNALRQRGKGSYYCPKGRRCDKGGVDKEGNLVRFDRNSSFIQHCNKHRKPWRCELSGCPNPPKKRKFARRDGLERHKATVKHFVMT